MRLSGKTAVVTGGAQGIGCALATRLAQDGAANKYALNIRFVTAGADPRPRTCERDVDFELTVCTR